MTDLSRAPGPVDVVVPGTQAVILNVAVERRTVALVNLGAHLSVDEPEHALSLLRSAIRAAVWKDAEQVLPRHAFDLRHHLLHCQHASGRPSPHSKSQRIPTARDGKGDPHQRPIRLPRRLHAPPLPAAESTVRVVSPPSEQRAICPDPGAYELSWLWH